MEQENIGYAEDNLEFTINYQGYSYKFHKISQPVIAFLVPDHMVAGDQYAITARVNILWDYPAKNYIVCYEDGDGIRKKFTSVGNEEIIEDAIEDGQILEGYGPPDNISNIIELMRNLVGAAPDHFELSDNALQIIDGIQDVNSI